MQTNQTSIEKALSVVVGLNPKVKLAPQEVKAISKLSNCDMSVALNFLRTAPFTLAANITRDSFGCKDLSDSNLFHRVGRIMYNKSSS